MTYSTSFRLDYFINNLDFITSDSGSLTVKSQRVARILPSNYRDKSEALNRADGFHLRFAKIAEALGKKLVFVELDFKQLRVTDVEGTKVHMHSWEQLLADKTFHNLLRKYNYSYQACAQAFLTAPVFATDPTSNVFNLRLSRFFTTSTMQSYKMPLEALLVISGEMIWSRWINTFILSQLVSSWFGVQNRAFILDYNGIWPALLYQPGAKLMRLDQSYFLPNFFYFGAVKHSKGIEEQKLKAYGKDGDDKSLLISPDRASIVSLDREYIFDGVVVRGDMYIAIASPQDFTPNRYRLWWPQKQFQLEKLPVYTIQPELEMNTEQLEFDLFADSLRVKSKDTVILGQAIGQVKVEKTYYQKVSAKDVKSLRLPLLEGQLVRVGEPLYHISGSLLTSTVNAQYTGQVSYKYLKQGMIAITEKQPTQELKSIFCGDVVSVSKKQARILTSALHIPMYKLVGKPCQGMLVASLDEVTLYPKIAVFSWQEFTLLDEQELIEADICAIVLTGVNQMEFIEYTSKHFALLSHINLALMDIYAEPAQKLLDLIGKFNGTYCVVREHDLALVLNTHQQKQYIDLIKAEDKEQGCKQGDLICRISYEQPMQYARIDKPSAEIDLTNVLFHG